MEKHIADFPARFWKVPKYSLPTGVHHRDLVFPIQKEPYKIKQTLEPQDKAINAAPESHYDRLFRDQGILHPF